MGKGSDILPRLTTRMTADVIAHQTGGDASKIKARLDQQQAKRARANSNPVDSLRFALRNACDSLGVDRVGEVLGVGVASLRKIGNPNETGRHLNLDIPLGRVMDLIGALKRAGCPEFLTNAIRAEASAGLEEEAKTVLPAVMHALATATSTRGDVAALLLDALAQRGRITAADVGPIAQAIEDDMAAMRTVLQQVISEARED